MSPEGLANLHIRLQQWLHSVVAGLSTLRGVPHTKPPYRYKGHKSAKVATKLQNLQRLFAIYMAVLPVTNINVPQGCLLHMCFETQVAHKSCDSDASEQTYMQRIVGEAHRRVAARSAHATASTLIPLPCLPQVSAPLTTGAAGSRPFSRAITANKPITEANTAALAHSASCTLVKSASRPSAAGPNNRPAGHEDSFYDMIWLSVMISIKGGVPQWPGGSVQCATRSSTARGGAGL